MANVINLALRGIELLFTVLIMALAGNMIASHSGPSVINYTIFVSLFALLSLFYLIAASAKEGLSIHPLLSVGLDGLNVLFFFCGGVALAAELGAHSCSNTDYTRHNSITSGTSNPGGRCREAQATTAFLWFGFVCFAVSAGLSAMSGKGRK